ncbi:hypothetical protein M427DRAFT_33561 [Gonapodya prolifera JEL478]|uniref:Uncharacterized protein n=1 Tax=Gonapodya prolifera (strain JEL478) TaxID=1344416 RepID=A0A139AAY4_GONPJ|nr:hypothetical protein M427DRAFT_33561 [Gonapodya prolifera JEL478]|eukprot:KXS13910.1 hypothetical protein M427DRAFT_33561 [Gonapodya prolifera JEL478]
MALGDVGAPSAVVAPGHAGAGPTRASSPVRGDGATSARNTSVAPTVANGRESAEELSDEQGSTAQGTSTVGARATTTLPRPAGERRAGLSSSPLSIRPSLSNDGPRLPATSPVLPVGSPNGQVVVRPSFSPSPARPSSVHQARAASFASLVQLAQRGAIGLPSTSSISAPPVVTNGFGRPPVRPSWARPPHAVFMSSPLQSPPGAPGEGSRAPSTTPGSAPLAAAGEGSRAPTTSPTSPVSAPAGISNGGGRPPPVSPSAISTVAAFLDVSESYAQSLVTRYADPSDPDPANTVVARLLERLQKLTEMVTANGVELPGNEEILMALQRSGEDIRGALLELSERGGGDGGAGAG